MERQIVEHTSPLWRLLAVGLFFAGVFFFGWAAKIFRLEEQFSTFFVITTFFAAAFWARKRPDKLKKRFGAYGKVALALQESADEIRASVYSRSIAHGLFFGACYAILIIVSKELVYTVVTSLYAWQLVAMAGCLTAAVVVAPQFFSAAAKHLSVPDDDPEGVRPREVGGREAIERGDEDMEHDGQRDVGERPEMDRNSEAKFASPDGSNEGIGYYDEEGNRLSPEQFQRLVAEKAERLRDEGNN